MNHNFNLLTISNESEKVECCRELQLKSEKESVQKLKFSKKYLGRFFKEYEIYPQDRRKYGDPLSISFDSTVDFLGQDSMLSLQAPTDSGTSDQHTVLFSGPMTIPTDLLNADLQLGSDQQSDDVKTEIQEN